MTKQVIDTITRYRLLAPGDRVLCALSGGGDSVCLTHILCALREELGVAVAAAHFSHGIRPEDGERERELARALCRALNIPFFHEAGDVPAFADRQKLGLEEAARLMRYDFLEQVADQWGATKIATGHTLDDNAETVLFHLVRGAGLKGLGGIPPARGRIIRPLIECTRDQVEDYLARHKLDYCTDPTNFDPGYSRNNIRLNLLPLLDGIHPGARRNIVRTAGLAREADACLEQEAGRLLPPPGAEDGLSCSALTCAHPALAAKAVQAAYLRAGGTAPLDHRHIGAVLDLCAAGPSARLSLPGGMQAFRRYGQLFFCAETQKNPPLPQTSLACGQTISWGEYSVSLAAEPGEQADWRWVLDKDRLNFPIFVRSRAPGDVLYTRAGHKTLKKICIDQKIPRPERDRLPIICDNMGVIAAPVPGCLARCAADAATADKLILLVRRTLL